MGNSLGCFAAGEQLAKAAREGDAAEARRLLESAGRGIARYSTFGGLNSPLHLAAAKGHNQIVTLLLENGADVNSRNIFGQTPLMQACRFGHWEVVQTLLLFRSNVSKVEYLSGRTALHFAAAGGHLRCIRLLVADFLPSVPYAACASPKSSLGQGNDKYVRFVNRATNGGITALHMAALNGYSDCVHLLLDLHANVSAATLYYTSSMGSIGAGSTPLHYAACGGNLQCCQFLIARGACRSTANCNGWLPLDVARIWGRYWLKPVLSPNADLTEPVFPPSSYLSLPLMSILYLAREFGLHSSNAPSDDSDLCAICLERACTVAAESCGHPLCIKCALYLCSTSKITSDMAGPPGSIPCPLCRYGIVSFIKLPTCPAKELKMNQALCLCKICIQNRAAAPCRPEVCMTVLAIPSELINPPSCNPLAPLPSACTPSHKPDDNRCPFAESQGQEHEQPYHHEKMKQRLENASCSEVFQKGSNGQREYQLNLEINV